jgi:phosphoribosylformylglycinamidine synthase subunit PurS
MKFKARIEVTLRENSIDPAAEAIRKSLVDLNFPVLSTKLAQIYDVTVEAKSRRDAEEFVQLMCTRLLANPAKDEYSFEVEEDGSSVPSKSDS